MGGHLVKYACQSCDYNSKTFFLGVPYGYLLHRDPFKDVPNEDKPRHLFECIDCGHFSQRSCEINIVIKRFNEEFVRSTEKRILENERIKRFRCGKCRGKLRVAFGMLEETPCPECKNKTLYEKEIGTWS